jgi:hypothetical protein
LLSGSVFGDQNPQGWIRFSLSKTWFTEGFDTPDLQEAKALLEALA